MNHTDESLQKVIDFLNHDSISYIVNMNEKAFSFISSSVLYINNSSELKINNLSNKYNLLFAAVAFKISMRTGYSDCIPIFLIYLKKIPEHFVSQSPFWKLISDNYDTLCKIREKFPHYSMFYAAFDFLLDYPEILL